MREDMYKVIVERPRRGGTRAGGASRGRIYRASEDVPSKIGIKHGIGPSKWLNENLAPLKRFIASQVNRPWDKVYSEICANIDRRNTVQEHIFTHIQDFVELHAQLVDGKVYVKSWHYRSDWIPLDESTLELYVHPRTGILLRNRHRKPRGWRKAVPQAADGTPRVERRELGEFEQLLRMGGIWYRVGLARLPPATQREVVDQGRPKIITEYETRWDLVRKCKVSLREGPGAAPEGPQALYGKRGVYAVSKRQLGERELKQYGLKEKGRETSRPFCFQAACRLHAGGVENIVGLVLHDLLLAHIAAAARHCRCNAALGGDALDVGHTGHRAAAHRRVGLDQLVGDAAGHRGCHRHLCASDLRAVHAFPGSGRAEILADLAAAAVVQPGVGADKHPFELAGGICLGAAFVGDAADADGFHSYLVAGRHLDRVGQAGLVVGHHAATGTGGEQGRGAGGESETFHGDILL